MAKKVVKAGATKNAEAPKSEKKTVAVITIRGAKEMGSRGRATIAAWLRKQADGLMKEGNEYAVRFTARYYR